MQRPNPATGRRPPVLVVQTDDDPRPLARRLAAGSASGLDLRGPAEPVLPEDLEAIAARRIAAELAGRRTAHRERTTELTAAVEAAATSHGEAAAVADAAAERRKRLLDGALWCEGRRGFVAEQVAALEAAGVGLAEADARLAEATAAAEVAAEAEAGRRAEVDEARRALLELDLAGRSEEELARALEAARQSAATAAAAAEAARRGAEQLAAEHQAAVQRRDTLAAELAALEAAGTADPGPVLAALERLEQTPLVPADAASLGLADDLERLAAERASLPPAVPAPDPAEVEQAEATAAAAHARLEELRRPAAPHEAPPWWDELTRLHSLVVDAESAAGGFRAKAGRRRLEDALAAERAFLEEVGYSSHLDALLSGGRTTSTRPGPLGIAQAEQAVVEAEQHLFELRAAASAAAAHARLRGDLLRVRALGCALLGVGPDQLTPARLRDRRLDPDAIEAVRAALAAAGVTGRATGAAEAARAWLAARAGVEERRPALRRAAAAAAEQAAVAAGAAQAAHTDAADGAATAAAARHAVEALEAELLRRTESTLGPAERAAAAEGLRARIAELEAEAAAGAALAAALGEVEVATAARQMAAASHAAVHGELAAVAARAAELAAELDAADVDPAADLADLGDLSVALRTVVGQLDLTIGETSRGVAGAAARLAASRAALASHQATTPQQPAATDIAAALAEAVGPEVRTTDVVVEPGLGFGPDGWEVLLDELARLGSVAPLAVVTSDPAFAAWAAAQPKRVVAVVPGRTVDPGPSTADRIDRAEAR